MQDGFTKKFIFNAIKNINLSTSPKKALSKRDFIIKKKIARHFMQYCECLSNPLPFYATQIKTLFLIKGSKPIKGKDFSQS